LRLGRWAVLSGHLIHLDSLPSFARRGSGWITAADAAYRSAKSKQWEAVILDVWRGKEAVAKESHLTEYDADHFLVKEEMTHFGAKKLILKDKKSGQIIEKTI